MRKFKRRQPSPTMIVAGVALIVALAGTAMAAPTAIKSVLDKKEKKQVKNIANTEANKVFNQQKGGLTGPTGPPGAQGVPGTNGATNVRIRQGTGTGEASAECNPGEVPTGGGASVGNNGALESSLPNVQVDVTLPNGRWTAHAVNAADPVTVRIICASP